jgi:hypothetical protein
MRGVMHMKINRERDLQGNVVYSFYCPACRKVHKIRETKYNFNHDYLKPTFYPDIIIEEQSIGSYILVTKCHCKIKDGIIHYYGDCGHLYINQKMMLPDMEKGD